MSKLIFPPGKRIFENKAYSKEFLELTLSEIREARDFTGILELNTGDIQDILFFLKGRPYASGRIEGQKHFSHHIRVFFENLPKGKKKSACLSLYETDPVILKSMLVFFQKEPAVKASAELLNFDDILSQIQNEPSGVLVILKKENSMNFFFFLKGLPVVSRYAEAVDKEILTLPAREQLLHFADQNSISPVEAFIYFDVSTSQASDAEDICEAELIEMLYKTEDNPPQLSLPSSLVLSVIEGPDQNKSFTVPLPCTIGRKDGDILLRDRGVSGRHAMMRESGKKLLIEDLDSTNGTYVNGVEVKARELFAKDVITVGETRLRIESITLPEL